MARIVGALVRWCVGALVRVVVLSAALVGCGGGSGGRALQGEVEAYMSAASSVSNASGCSGLDQAAFSRCSDALVGKPCPADTTFMADVKAGSTVTVEDANHKTVASTQLVSGQITNHAFSCTFTFSAKLTGGTSDFYTVQIEGQSGNQAYSLADLKRMKWQVSLKAT